MKNKKAVDNMWWIIIGAIVAIVVGASLLYIVRGGLATQQKNIAALSSCGNLGGRCSTTECPPAETSFSSYGCDKNEVCCVPKEKPEKKNT